MPKPYTPEFRAEIVAHAAGHGVTAAALKFGVSKGSVSQWAHAAGVETVQSEKMAAAQEALAAHRALIREEVRTLMLEQARDMLLRMNEPHIDFKGNGAQQVEYPIASSGDCQRYAIAAATMLDKYRLEVGESTDRTELVGERERLVADADERALRLVGRPSAG